MLANLALFSLGARLGHVHFPHGGAAPHSGGKSEIPAESPKFRRIVKNSNGLRAETLLFDTPALFDTTALLNKTGY